MVRRARRPKKKRSRRLKFFIFLFFCFCFSLVIVYLLSLPIWKIQAVSVRGAQMLSAEEIANLSGVPLNENLFFSSFARVRANLRKIPAIKEFHLYRIPPSTVLISLTERKPIAIIVLKDKSALIDEDGYIINHNPRLSLNIPNLTDLPVVAGIGAGEIANGEQIDPKISRLVANIIVDLSKLLGSRRLQLETGNFTNINFLLDDILLVKVGRDENIDRKMAIFKRFLPVIEGRWPQVEYIDVRYVDNPAIKYR